MTPAGLVATYIHAKDSNRPHLVRSAFAEDATLEMVVNAGSIAFPPNASGVDAIADVLVSRFAQSFENIYTFCLSAPPHGAPASFSCAWLVGMSEKAGGAVRVGCGTYDWTFGESPDARVERLRIVIESMQSLDPSMSPRVMQWLSALPYPWCAAEDAFQAMPRAPELAEIARRCRTISGSPVK